MFLNIGFLLMPFNTPLKLKSIRGSNKYQLLDFLCYEDFCSGKIICVKRGFITDFASIPRFLKFFIDDNDPFIRDAAVLHDYLYSNEALFLRVTRYEADKYLYKAMKSLANGSCFIWTNRIKRSIVFLSVRAAGWMFFKGYKNSNV